MIINVTINLVMELPLALLMHLEHIVAFVREGGLVRIAVLTLMNAVWIWCHLVTMVVHVSTLMDHLNAVVLLVTKVNIIVQSAELTR